MEGLVALAVVVAVVELEEQEAPVGPAVAVAVPEAPVGPAVAVAVPEAPVEQAEKEERAALERAALAAEAELAPAVAADTPSTMPTIH